MDKKYLKGTQKQSATSSKLGQGSKSEGTNPING